MVLEGTFATSSPRRRQLWLLGARLGVASLLLGGVVLVRGLEPGDDLTSEALLVLVAATFASALGVAVALPRSRRPELWAALQIAWDLVLVTGLVYLLGGALSGFAFLYGVVILAAALTIGPRAATVTAGVALMAYVVVGLGLANGWLPAPGGEPPVSAPDQIGLAILRTLVGLVLVGLLAGALAERLRRTGGQLRRAAASAAELTRLNEDILRSLGSGLLICDRERRISRANPAGARLLGSAPEALVGRPIEELLPLDADPDAPALDRGEGTGTRVDGSAFPVGFSRSPLCDAEGRVLGTLVLFSDLSELRELRAQAEHAERLAALGRLAAGLAHEIRNPLGSISGSVEMVREAPALGEEDRRLLSLVSSEVERLNDLVTTMLDVGRPRAPELLDVDLGALTADVCRVAEARSNVHVVLSTAEAPIVVRADPAQLRQVLWNLVKNALQFTPAGGTVRVRVDRDDAGPRLTVTDEGPGVAEEDRPHVFDMFYSKRRHGVGLGLALVRQIVEAHGGTVELADGDGASFVVRLPEATLEAAQTRPSLA